MNQSILEDKSIGFTRFLTMCMYTLTKTEEKTQSNVSCKLATVVSPTDPNASPGCPVVLTHLFLWLTCAPLVARKRAAASFPASAACCSKQFPRRKWANSFFQVHKNEVQFTILCLLHHLLPLSSTHQEEVPLKSTWARSICGHRDWDKPGRSRHLVWVRKHSFSAGSALATAQDQSKLYLLTGTGSEQFLLSVPLALGPDNSLLWGAYPMHCTVCSVPGFCPLDASCNSDLVATIKNVYG